MIETKAVACLARQLLVANGRLRTGFLLDINDRKSQIIHARNWTLSVGRRAFAL